MDGRLRVFADQRRVWAETPVTATEQVTPHWSYRRWPAEAVGVVAVERQFLWGGSALVVTKWSDGAVVALEATTGTVIWQVHVSIRTPKRPTGAGVRARRRCTPRTACSPPSRPVTAGWCCWSLARTRSTPMTRVLGAELWARAFSG